MRTVFLMLTLALSACTTSLNAFDVPRDLQSCPAGQAPSAPPPLPRTTETIAKAYNKEKIAAEVTYDALKECRAKHARLIQWIKGK